MCSIGEQPPPQPAPTLHMPARADPVILTVGEASDPSESGDGNMRHVPIHAEDGLRLASVHRSLGVGGVSPNLTSPKCCKERNARQCGPPQSDCEADPTYHPQVRGSLTPGSHPQEAAEQRPRDQVLSLPDPLADAPAGELGGGGGQLSQCCLLHVPRQVTVARQRLKGPRQTCNSHETAGLHAARPAKEELETIL